MSDLILSVLNLRQNAGNQRPGRCRVHPRWLQTFCVPDGIANTMFGYSASEKKKNPGSPRALQIVHLLKVAFLCLDASSTSEINS